MADVGGPVVALLDVFRNLFGPLVRVAIRGLLASAIGVACASACLLASSFWLGARHGSARHGFIALAVAAVAVAIMGPILVLERTVGRTVVHALTSLGAGRKIVSVLFDGLLKIDETGEVGARGSIAQRGLERFPLVEVEHRLKRVIVHLTDGNDRFLARRLRAALLRRVARYTLEELRAGGESGGGVDLALVRQRLEATVDGALVKRAQAALAATTLTLVLLLAIIGLGAALLIGR